MKRLFMFLALTLSFAVSLAQSGNLFFVSPEKPKAGETITIIYNPSLAEFQNSKSISMLVHFYSKQVDETNEYDLKKESKGWTTNFKTSDSTYGVLIHFSDGEIYDNNENKCFPIYMYSTDGKPIAGAKAGLARGYINWIQAFEIEPDADLALKLFTEEFKIFPALKKDFFMDYYRAFSKIDKEKAAEMVKTEIPIMEKSLTQSEDDLIILMNLHRINKDMDKFQKTQALYLEKYPQGKMSEQNKFSEYYNSKDPVKKAELAKKFKEEFPNSQYLSTLKMNDLNELIKAGKYDETYSALINDPKASSALYNTLAWDMYEKGSNLQLAKEIAAQGVELSRAETDKSDIKKPGYYSQKKWEEIRKTSAYAMIDTYGAILLKLGENREALILLEEAATLDKGRSADVNERYSQALVANQKYDKAKEVIEKSYASGQSTLVMKDLLKESYLKLGKSEADFENGFEAISKSASEKRVKELEKEMINIPAPKFVLEDFNGNKVSLEDLNGKVVIIDFWATWCGPCKASFPGMQRAVNKYANDPNVQFLFVNSWERVEDKKKSASDFISQNKYTFKVLMDNDDKVITSFKVDGIPTKFIIDQKGSIRFKSVGFSGSDDKLVDEISSMINMLK
jgi:thiol-disulfide isomerase/thioredoxin